MTVVSYTIGTRVAPVVATVVVIVTLITCVSIAKAKDIYLGGLAWPYFSDTGRDSPGYTIFCVGLSVVAIALVLTWTANYQFQRELIEKETRINSENLYGATIRTYSEAVRIFGVLSAFGLPVLAFFSTTSYDTVHKYAAYWFFILEAFALLINTIASFKIARLSDVSKDRYYNSESEEPTPTFDPWNVVKSSTKRTFYIQVVCTSLFLIAFVLYIPVGVTLIDEFQRLSIKDCLKLKLGEKYCTDTMQLNDTETVLWNYDNNHGLNQMRSASQLMCILTLVGYSMSFLSHNKESQPVVSHSNPKKLIESLSIEDAPTSMAALTYTIGTGIAPVVATFVVIVTLITCVSIAKAKNIYLGGLEWPYLSDTGRDNCESQAFTSVQDLPYVMEADAPKAPNVAIPSLNSSAKRTFHIQLVMATLFFIAFLLYIPIGMAIVEEFQRLTIKDCLAINLGEEYCTVTMRLNDMETKLWNYDNDHGTNQMRSGSQLACILTLVGYSLSFFSHKSEYYYLSNR